MIKTYKSPTVLSFTTRLSNGTLKRIRFGQYSWGGSLYATEDKLVQEAIEKEPLFGKLFTLESVEETEEEKAAKAKKPVKEDKAEDIEQPTTDESQEEVSEPKNVIKVADFSEAKEYLMENYGYKSAQLRSQKSITDAAEKNNITFEYA